MPTKSRVEKKGGAGTGKKKEVTDERKETAAGRVEKTESRREVEREEQHKVICELQGASTKCTRMDLVLGGLKLDLIHI